jgi:hypothetical protein
MLPPFRPALARNQLTGCQGKNSLYPADMHTNPEGVPGRFERRIVKDTIGVLPSRRRGLPERYQRERICFYRSHTPSFPGHPRVHRLTAAN